MQVLQSPLASSLLRSSSTALTGVSMATPLFLKDLTEVIWHCRLLTSRCSVFALLTLVSAEPTMDHQSFHPQISPEWLIVSELLGSFFFLFFFWAPIPAQYLWPRSDHVISLCRDFCSFSIKTPIPTQSRVKHRNIIDLQARAVAASLTPLSLQEWKQDLCRRKKGERENREGERKRRKKYGERGGREEKRTGNKEGRKRGRER